MPKPFRLSYEEECDDIARHIRRLTGRDGISAQPAYIRTTIRGILKALKLFNRGMGIAEIARREGVSSKTVSRRLKVLEKEAELLARSHRREIDIEISNLVASRGPYKRLDAAEWNQFLDFRESEKEERGVYPSARECVAWIFEKWKKKYTVEGLRRKLRQSRA